MTVDSPKIIMMGESIRQNGDETDIRCSIHMIRQNNTGSKYEGGRKILDQLMRLLDLVTCLVNMSANIFKIDASW